LHKTLKFDKVMPIQKACIPIFSKNYDVAVEVLLNLLKSSLIYSIGCHWQWEVSRIPPPNHP
jgi:hypothetical protein